MKISRLVAPLLVLSLIAAAGLVASCGGGNDGGVLTPPAKELDSGNLAGGGAGVYPHKFTTAGTYNYHCTLHSGMTGKVIVVPGAPATVSVSITGFAFNPSTASVDTGGTVTWTNNDGTAHTVTSN